MVTTPLREKMRQAIRIRNMSIRTEQVYLEPVARFARHFHRSPDRLGLPEIEQYLLPLRDVRKVSWCWFNQTVSALRFFYLYVLDRPDLVIRIPFGRRERHLPVVLSVEELIALLSNITTLRDRLRFVKLGSPISRRCQYGRANPKPRLAAAIGGTNVRRRDDSAVPVSRSRGVGSF